MNRFNLNQLRNDVIDHTDLFHTAIIDGTPFWRDQWTDWILIQLIGSDHYDLMLRHPNMVIVFKEINDNVRYGQYLSYNW